MTKLDGISKRLDELDYIAEYLDKRIHTLRERLQKLMNEVKEIKDNGTIGDYWGSGS